MNILEARRRMLDAEVYKKTASGNPVNVGSLARTRPGLKVFGRSEQFTTTGAQLLNIPDDYTGENNGVTWSANGGVIHVSGTATSDVFTTNVDITDLIEPGQDYYISDNINGVPIFAYLEAHYTDETPNDYSQNNVYTAKPNIEKVIFYINVSPGATVDADVYPMLNAGSTAKPWEPYTGGAPSPSPDYPQEIVSAGDDGSIQVDVTGTQLFDISKATPFAIAFGLETTVDGEYITLQGVSTRTGLSQFRLININQPYFDAVWKITDVEEEVGATVAHLQAPKNDGVNFTDALTILCTLNEGVEVKLRFKIMASKSGSTTWEPYKQPQTITIQTPNGLPGIPVSSGGNYTDADGQQWICDEIDFKRGKYVKRIGSVLADGVVNKFTASSDGIFWNLNTDHSAPGVISGKPYFSYYFGKEFFGANEPGEFIYTIDERGSKYFDTVDDLNAFCIEKNTEGNPLIIYYPMEPIETDLSEEQLSAYANIHTNRPTTVVTATDDAGLELTYKTKKSLEVTD